MTNNHQLVKLSILASLAVMLNSCSGDASSRANAKADPKASESSEEALSGGLELAQPALPAGAKADLFKLEIFKIGDCGEKPAVGDSSTEVTVALNSADSSEDKAPCKQKIARKRFGAESPLQPGKIHRIPHLPQGSYVISIKYIKISAEGAASDRIVYYGEAIAVVDDKGEGKVEVVLKPFEDAKGSLIITTKVEE